MQTAQVIPFRFDDREVRTLLIDDQPWFCAADVCDALGYANSRKAISDNCREAGVTASDISSGGQKRRVTFINEGNLYRLIIKSRKEEAQRFEAWVCDEVLPSIRKHGRYVDESGKLDSLVGSVIGTSGVLVLDRVIEQKASPIPQGMRRSFKHTMKSRLRSRFNVQRTELIPAEQLADACNFVAAYALEGEWIPKQREGDFTLSSYQAQSVYLLVHHAKLCCRRWDREMSAGVRSINRQLWDRTHEHFCGARRAAQSLEVNLPEMIGYFRERLGGLLPEENQQHAAA